MIGMNRKAQVSVEYLMVTSVMLTIIVIIFGVAVVTSGENIKSRQTSESLETLTQTADLVYALGNENVIYTEIIWPSDVSNISIIYNCLTGTDVTGCSGGQGAVCNCAGNPGDECVQTGPGTHSVDCVENSAIVVDTKFFGAPTQLIYPTRSKLEINKETDDFCHSIFRVNNVSYRVKVSWGSNGAVQLCKPCPPGQPALCN
ncbi:MAG: hypothetical protein JW772_01500 [Candidatus Diapherotrites archaeon]|nr:hypothetical protein [Candidatus Diapherotrites archaeon]